MKTWLVKDARARLADVMTGALAGEPQRVTRRGREAVVMVSEKDWDAAARQTPPKKSLGQLLSEFPLTHEEWLEVAPGPMPLRSKLPGERD